MKLPSRLPTDDELRDMLGRWRAKYPVIVNAWKKLSEEIQDMRKN
jgi:hypothetical protein